MSSGKGQIFACRNPGCRGVVRYEAEEIPGLLPNITAAFDCPLKTKRVYLVCDNPDERHERAYDVPIATMRAASRSASFQRAGTRGRR